MANSLKPTHAKNIFAFNAHTSKLATQEIRDKKEIILISFILEIFILNR